MRSASLRTIIALAVTAACLPRVLSAGQTSSRQRALLDLFVNDVSRGQVLVVITPQDVWVGVEMLAGAGLSGFDGERDVIDGTESVRLGSLAPGIAFTVDDRDLTLRVVANPRFLPSTQLTLQGLRPPDLDRGRNTSGFLSYAVNWNRATSVDGFLDLGAHAGSLLAQTTVIGGANRPIVRGLSNVVVDRPGRLQRWVLGDAYANTGVLGGAALLGGVGVSREYAVDPYFQRVPTLDMAGAVTTPSTLEVYVNDRLVRREDIAPGRFNVVSLPASVGYGVARVVVRDAFGGAQELAASFYLTTHTLRKGHQEYAYHVGYERIGESQSAWAYSEPMLLARHRVGFTNSVTGGYRLELSEGMVSGGPTLNLRSRIGEFEVAVGASREASVRGTAASANYEFISKSIGFGASGRYLEQSYATASIRPFDPRPRIEATVYGAVPVGPRVSVTVRQVVAERVATPRSNASVVQASVQLIRVARLNVSASNDWSNRNVGASAVATIGVFFGGRTTMNVGAERTSRTNHSTVELQRTLAPGTGMGYRLLADAATNTGTAALQYQGGYGRYEVWDDAANGRHTASMRASGSIVAIGGGVYASRAVQDGFALVRVPHVAGVRAYANNQEIGRTDRHGNLLVPGLLPYYGNRLSIADQDVPLDNRVDATERLIAPPYRGGAVVTFPVDKFQIRSGRVLVRRSSEVIVPQFGELTVRFDDRAIESPIGQNGEFSLQNVPAGRLPAEIMYRDGICRFILDVPPSIVPVLDIGSVECIETSTP